MARVLIIPDLQAPFQHPAALKFLKKTYKKYNCNRVICIGDEVDYKFLKYSHIDDPDTAQIQHHKALKFMKRLYDAFPRVAVCKSNHGRRLERRAAEAGIAEFFLRGVHEYLQAPASWTWHDSIMLDNVVFEHGDRFGGLGAIRKAVNSNMRSTVIGHFASQLGVQYITNPRGVFFGMVVGCMVDIKSYGMNYAKVYPSRPALGCGVVIDGVHAIAEPYIE